MKITQTCLCLIILSLAITNLFAQDDYRFFTITTQEKGLCYAQCMIQTQYDTISESVLVSPSSTIYTIVEPTFEEIEETIEIMPERIEYKVIPAVYETIEEVITLQESYTYYKEANRSKKEEEECLVDAGEQIEIAPPVREWTLYRHENCKSKDWNDCIYFQLDNIPIKYYNKDLKVNNCSPLSPESVTEDAKTITISRKMLVTPERVEEVRLPAEFKTIKRKVVKSHASTALEEIPTKYESVDKLILRKEGGEIIKMNVLCEDILLSNLSVLQKTLKTKGYMKGKIEKEVTDKLKAAITQYQIDYGLPIGQFDYLTMDHLGIKF